VGTWGGDLGWGLRGATTAPRPLGAPPGPPRHRTHPTATIARQQPSQRPRDAHRPPRHTAGPAGATRGPCPGPPRRAGPVVEANACPGSSPSFTPIVRSHSFCARHPTVFEPSCRCSLITCETHRFHGAPRTDRRTNSRMSGSKTLGCAPLFTLTRGSKTPGSYRSIDRVRPIYYYLIVR